MRQIFPLLVLAAVLTSCSADSELARVRSPDGEACVIVATKEKRGMPLPGPEPPKTLARWARFSVEVNGKTVHDTGDQEIGVHQPLPFALESWGSACCREVEVFSAVTWPMGASRIAPPLSWPGGMARGVRLIGSEIDGRRRMPPVAHALALPAAPRQTNAKQTLDLITTEVVLPGSSKEYDHAVSHVSSSR